jgi:hypothetical protein
VIYDEMRARTGFTPALPPDATGAIHSAENAGENDQKVHRTFNGLRPEDRALEQPPQRADWRPA